MIYYDMLSKQSETPILHVYDVNLIHLDSNDILIGNIEMFRLFTVTNNDDLLYITICFT